MHTVKCRVNKIVGPHDGARKTSREIKNAGMILHNEVTYGDKWAK